MLLGDTWNDQFVRPLHADEVVLLVVDMQPLFYSADSAWGNPLGLDGSAMKDIVPLVKRLARGVTALSGDPTRVALTQFITPEEARDAAGSWRHYYTAEGNRDVTQAAMRKRGLNVTHMLSVMPGLQNLTATGALLNKTTASAFGSGSTRQWLAQRPWVTALVIAGVETDYCVLATALSAVDAGYRVILVEDGIASTQPHSGHATIDYIARRFDSQIELGTADDILQQLRSGCGATATAK
jgi:nicotinamidase-related amidase